MASDTRQFFGETFDIRAKFVEDDATDFTIDSATVSIWDAEGTVIRDEVAATVSGAEVYYQEAWTEANSYEAGREYTYRFTANITRGALSPKLFHEDTVFLHETP